MLAYRAVMCSGYVRRSMALTLPARCGLNRRLYFNPFPLSPSPVFTGLFFVRDLCQFSRSCTGLGLGLLLRWNLQGVGFGAWVFMPVPVYESGAGRDFALPEPIHCTQCIAIFCVWQAFLVVFRKLTMLGFGAFLLRFWGYCYNHIVKKVWEPAWMLGSLL